jgi:hypothetical protein
MDLLPHIDGFSLTVYGYRRTPAKENDGGREEEQKVRKVFASPNGAPSELGPIFNG